jgi:hypothetical protein
MLSMIWSAIQIANSKSARKKKKQPRTPNVLLSVHLRIATRVRAKKNPAAHTSWGPRSGVFRGDS